MKTTIAVTAFSILGITAGCKQDDKKKSSSDPHTKVTDSAPKQESGPFATWDMAARRAAFKGAFVAPGDAIGQWEAWEITGDQVRSWDGTEELTRTLEVKSPCTVTVTKTNADGSSEGVTHHYTLKDGVMITGLGDAGSRKGAEAVACVSNLVFTLDAKGACTTWELDVFGEKWESAPGTCSLGKDGDKEVFKATVRDHETVLLVEGDVIWSEQFARDHSAVAADFAAAKTARDAR